MPIYFGSEVEYRGLEECLRWAIDAVGPSKLMWGSDIPATLPQATYQQLHDVIADRVSFLDTRSQRGIFGENALQVYWGSVNAAGGSASVEH